MSPEHFCRQYGKYFEPCEKPQVLRGQNFPGRSNAGRCQVAGRRRGCGVKDILIRHPHRRVESRAWLALSTSPSSI